MIDEKSLNAGKLDRRIIEARIPALRGLIDETSEFSELAEMAMRAAHRILESSHVEHG